MPRPDVIIVGKIMRTHGLKGQLLLWINQNSFRNSTLNNLTIFLYDAQDQCALKVDDSKYLKNNTWLIRLKNHNHINEVEDFVHCLVGFRDQDLELIPQSADYKNWKIIYQQTVVGHVVNIEDYGAHPLLRIQPLDANAKTWLLPWVDAFVESVNQSEQTFIIKDIELANFVN